LSVIEDTRKLIQDFLAPELREIATKLDALERRINQKFESSERLANDRYASIMHTFGQLST
jgi:dsDNA-specific endonuclease/ATPase MutS2